MVLPRGPRGEYRAGVPSGSLTTRPRKETSADIGPRISDAGTDERGYCVYVFEFANVAWPFVGHQGVPEGCVSADDRGAVAERGRPERVNDLRQSSFAFSVRLRAFLAAWFSSFGATAKSNFDTARSNFMTTKSNFTTTKSNFLTPRSNLMRPKSNLMTTKSNFITTKSNFRTAGSNFGTPYLNFGTPYLNFETTFRKTGLNILSHCRTRC